MARQNWILTAKEKEFILDWLKVVDGEMEPAEFYDKWSTKKCDKNFYDDLEALEDGKITLEEFREKWTKKGDWKNRIRVMRNRLEWKRKNIKKIRQEILEEMRLLAEFFSLDELP